MSEITQRPIVRLILVHGVGETKFGELKDAVRMHIEKHSTDLDPNRAPIEISVVHWSDLHDGLSPSGQFSPASWNTMREALILAASQFPADAEKAFSVLRLLLVLAYSAPFLLMTLSLACALIKAGNEYFHWLHVHIAFPLPASALLTWSIVGAVVIPFAALLIAPFIASAFAPQYRRAKVFIITLRTCTLLVAIPLLSLLVLPRLALNRSQLLALGLSALLAFYYCPATAFPFSFIVCAWLVLGFMFQAIHRNMCDVLAFAGNTHFRDTVTARLRSTLQSSKSESVILVGHSLGSVIIAHVLWSDQDRKICKLFSSVRIITMGSPITRFFNRFFPNDFFPSNMFQLFLDIQEHIPSLRWLNIYRPFDYVGASLGLPETVVTSEESTGQFARFHTGYWRDPVVAQIAYDWLTRNNDATVTRSFPLKRQLHKILKRDLKRISTTCRNSIIIAFVMLWLFNISQLVAACVNAKHVISLIQSSGKTATGHARIRIDIADTDFLSIRRQVEVVSFDADGDHVVSTEIDPLLIDANDSSFDAGDHFVSIRYLESDHSKFFVTEMPSAPIVKMIELGMQTSVIQGVVCVFALIVHEILLLLIRATVLPSVQARKVKNVRAGPKNDMLP